MRNILIHCHMFKNAGSSLDWSLQRNFKSGFIDHRDDAEMRLGKEYLEKYLLRNSGVNALSSHHIKMPLPAISKVNLFPIFLFRHPLERAGSVYEFEKTQKSDTPGAVNAKKMDFSDYVRWRMESSSGPTIRNFQTRYCIGKITKPGIELTDDDFSDAKRLISEIKLIGLVENYDLSMVYFEYILKEYFPSLNLVYVRQNTNQSPFLTTDDKIDIVFQKLDSEAAELLREHNKYDLLLYNYASSVFSKRVADVHNIEKKMEEFRIRCSEL